VVEILISALLVALFCVMGWATQAPGETLLIAGLAAAAFGFAYGIPTALVYHYLLYRSLSACDRLPPKWWLQPTSLHDQIPLRDRTGVFVWGAIGGSGFVFVVVGILLTSLGLWRTLSA
jgi:hypothetical protein